MELKRFKMYPLICQRSRYKNILLDHYVNNHIQANKKSRRPLLLQLHDYNQICINTFPPKYGGNTLTQKNNSKLPQKECCIYTPNNRIISGKHWPKKFQFSQNIEYAIKRRFPFELQVTIRQTQLIPFHITCLAQFNLSTFPFFSWTICLIISLICKSIFSPCHASPSC